MFYSFSIIMYPYVDWLGLVTHLMHTKVFVRWLEKDDKGIWFVSTTREDSQLLSTIIAHNVSLSILDGTMQPELHGWLVCAWQKWDEQACGTATDGN